MIPRLRHLLAVAALAGFAAGCGPGASPDSPAGGVCADAGGGTAFGRFALHRVADDSIGRVDAIRDTVSNAPPGFLRVDEPGTGFRDGWGFPDPLRGFAWVRDPSVPIDSAALHAFGNPPPGVICVVARIRGEGETARYRPMFVHEEPVFLPERPPKRVAPDATTAGPALSIGLARRDAARFRRIVRRFADEHPAVNLAACLGDAVVSWFWVDGSGGSGGFVLAGPFSKPDVARLATILPSACVPVPDAVPSRFFWDETHAFGAPAP